jgi:tyrosine-protein kinase Etk/Wzc
MRRTIDDIVARVGRNARVIIAASMLGAFVGGAYFIVAPRWYQSIVTVVPTGPAKPSGLPAGLASALGASAELGLDLGLSSDIERIAAVFQSNSVTDAAIHKFQLLERYGDKHIETARKEVWSHCSVSIDRKARIVSLTCEDRDPQFAQRLVAFFAEIGNSTIRRIGASAGSEEVRFLEKRVTEMEKQADDAALDLRSFEERHKVVDLETQSKAVVGAIASLRGQQINKELELSYMRSFSSGDEATASQLRQQLSIISAKYRALDDARSIEAGTRATTETDAPADLFPAAMTIPKLEYELSRLLRERKIYEGNVLLLRQRLELAKVNEARDTSAFQVLDAPVAATYKSRPRGSISLAIGLFLGFVAGLAWVYGPTYVKRALADGMR